MLLLASIAACSAEPRAGGEPLLPAEPVAAEIGAPLPGLTPEERARFDAGHVHFSRRFAPEEGLGPRFNEDACNACHTSPTDGGTGETSVRKATRTLPDGSCDPLSVLGGENLRIQATPALADRGHGRVAPPDGKAHGPG